MDKAHKKSIYIFHFQPLWWIWGSERTLCQQSTYKFWICLFTTYFPCCWWWRCYIILCTTMIDERLDHMKRYIYMGINSKLAKIPWTRINAKTLSQDKKTDSHLQWAYFNKAVFFFFFFNFLGYLSGKSSAVIRVHCITAGYGERTMIGE